MFWSSGPSVTGEGMYEKGLISKVQHKSCTVPAFLDDSEMWGCCEGVGEGRDLKSSLGIRYVMLPEG